MRKNTRRFWISALALVSALAVGGYAAAHSMGSGLMGRGGMMGMMGSGMMGQGGMMGMMQQCSRMMEGATVASATPLTQERAEAVAKQYLASLRNPNLKLGTIKEEEDRFIADIVTKDNSLVDKLVVDKRTGTVRSIY